MALLASVLKILSCKKVLIMSRHVLHSDKPLLKITTRSTLCFNRREEVEEGKKKLLLRTKNAVGLASTAGKVS